MSGEIEVAMGCRAIRERLNEALAAGKTEALDRDTALHLRTCSGCRDHYDVQAKLYGAIDSGVRRLVENAAPPSLLPGVRERLAVAVPQPNRAWVRALAPSAVALLFASGLLLLIQAHTRGNRRANEVVSIQVSPYSDVSSTSLGSQKRGINERETVESGKRRAISRNGTLKPARSSNAMAPVIFDRQESQAIAHLANEIGKNPELARMLLHEAALPPDQPAAIQPLSIAKIEIQSLGEENR